LVAALASRLDALAHQGLWHVRIEDTDLLRTAPDAEEQILAVLNDLGFAWDGAIEHQTEHDADYARAFAALKAQGLTYECICSRKELADSALPGVDGAPIYPGTCRDQPADSDPINRSRRAAARVRVDSAVIRFVDRIQGEQEQDLAAEVGDFILRRADGVWAYQLAVVVDDARQGVTDVVRGADLLASTARQIFLQAHLGLPRPRYLHVPVLTNALGEKLSKQTGAAPVESGKGLAALHAAAAFLGLGPLSEPSIDGFWAAAVPLWRARHRLPY